MTASQRHLAKIKPKSRAWSDLDVSEDWRLPFKLWNIQTNAIKDLSYKQAVKARTLIYFNEWEFLPNTFTILNHRNSVKWDTRKTRIQFLCRKHCKEKEAKFD